VSNFPLSYKLSWLPRLLRPSLSGDRSGLEPRRAVWIDPPPQRRARLVFIGDISAVANCDAPWVDPSLRALLSSADLVVGNCESPVVARPHRPLGTRLGARHAMAPDFLRQALDAAGIAREKLVLSVANNHALDQGNEGFDETLSALRGLGIRAVGLAAEPMARVALDPASPDGAQGALALGLAAFSLWRNTEARGFDGRVTMAGEPTGWPIEAMRGCDLVCALPHWDREFRHFPQASTRTMARRLAEARVGLVVGGHAHVVQPVERFGDSLVAYGLGDFLGTVVPRPSWPCRIGAALAVEVSLEARTRGRLASYRVHPFFRLRHRRRERLVPIESLDMARRGHVERRLAAVLGEA
jgi:poly-gamma-glutamate capsule biosynthesis protein CapA/YwtB (metallophosphatase superfamily)